MSNEIRTGKQILDSFFDGLTELPDVDKELADTLVRLYRANKLTANNISNALLEIRQRAMK